MQTTGWYVVLGAAGLAVVWWLLRAPADEAREDPRPGQLHRATAKRLGNPLTIPAAQTDPETGQTTMVDWPVDPAAIWEIVARDPAHPEGRPAEARLKHYAEDFPVGNATRRAEIEAQVASVLGCARHGERVEGDWWSQGHGRAHFQVVPAPPPLPTTAPLRVLRDLPDDLAETRIPFGLTDPDAPFAVPAGGRTVATLDLKAGPHTLITGATGSLKSSAVRGLIAVILWLRRTRGYDWEVIVLNGKEDGGFAYLIGQPGVRKVLRSHAQIAQAVRELAKEVADRYAQDGDAADAGQDRPKFSRVFVFCDERMDVVEQLRDAGERKRFNADHGSIMRKARAVRVHWFDITQRADVEGTAGKALAGEARFNLPGRLALGYHDEAASLMTLRDSKLGQTIANVPARGIYKVGDDHQRVQCFALPDPDDEDAPAEARAATRRWLPTKAERPATTVKVVSDAG